MSGLSRLYAASPLVLIRDVTGHDHYFYRDEPVTGEFDKDRIQELLDEGHLVRAEPVEVEVTPQEARDLDVPVRSAKKPVWVQYAIAQGMDPAEANAATKDVLLARFLAPADPETDDPDDDPEADEDDGADPVTEA